MNHRPPALARALLRRFVSAERLAEVEGDCLELFHGRVVESGAR